MTLIANNRTSRDAIVGRVRKALRKTGDDEKARAAAEAYLAAHQPAQAAGEFQRILDHRSIVLVDPVDAMARLQLARALADDAVKANAFYEEALARGHEGLMAKALDAPYEAGRRGAGWLKLKRAKTLDLVVIGVEWGSGRRKGWLSNLHLGARDPRSGGFVMLGKTFKGLTDEILEWQTRELLAREVKRDEWTVYVRPELVVEIAFNDVQSSSQYPGGMALRFARLKGYRPDKRADEADTIDTVREIFEAQLQ